MSNKIMIINWKFRVGGKPEDNKEYKICGDESYLIITCNKSNTEQSLSDFKTFIGQKSKQLYNDDVLIFLHMGDDNKISVNDILQTSKQFKTIKIREFSGGANKNHPVYYDTKNYPLGLLGGSKFKDSACIEQDSNTLIKKKNFEFVWDWYWNKLELETQKKAIINLWLPLAIDIQGLSEVEENKRESYLNEVNAELDKDEYIKNLSNGWEEVKKILLPDNEKEVLDEKYRLTDDEKKKVSFPVIEITAEKLKNFVKDNLKQKDKPAFLPNWLQEVVEIIDPKISKAESPTTGKTIKK